MLVLVPFTALRSIFCSLRHTTNAPRPTSDTSLSLRSTDITLACTTLQNNQNTYNTSLSTMHAFTAAMQTCGRFTSVRRPRFDIILKHFDLICGGRHLRMSSCNRISFITADNARFSKLTAIFVYVYTSPRQLLQKLKGNTGSSHALN